jgi:uncharacterized membrane protein
MNQKSGRFAQSMGFLIDTSIWIAVERGRMGAADIHEFAREIAKEVVKKLAKKPAAKSSKAVKKPPKKTSEKKSEAAPKAPQPET